MTEPRIIPLKRLLLRYIGGRWHIGIAIKGQQIVVHTLVAGGPPVVNLLPLSTTAEADDWQTQLAEAFD